ncbi:NADH-quinone oxidoreductase subunit G [Rhodococcus gannanensis]|uniref:NADH-quinone oxidoreductase n=1 Tax=Rhodococcus gannanensis TaxID=1960308 RepID=A0ABW4P2A5_9NOCA
MTLQENISAPADLVTVTIDGAEVAVPKGTLVIRAAELVGIQIPRFCDHPLLDPVGACRQCLVEVWLPGREPGAPAAKLPKPMASCTTTVSEGMVVHTQLTSPDADRAQRSVMEMLLINHPLDCPVCDKGGECPLQNQAMSNGRSESRFDGVKRTYPKPIPLSTEVLLDRERCVLCARCTRFSQQVAGDPFIELLERGALQQVGIGEGEPFESYFSGNTVQICPVGALTGAAYRFRARPFDLVSSPSVCEHCASGCAQRTDHRRGTVLRRLAGDDPEVNEEWNCDKGRWAFAYATADDRLTTPLVRAASGELEPASWSQALAIAAKGLQDADATGVLTGGRLTVEDAYAYAKFARVALGTNNIDFRFRPHSAEETQFLAARVAGNRMDVTYADLERASAVLLVNLEPEEESPIVFLRLRKAVRRHSLAVRSVAPYASRGLEKLSGRLVQTGPGGEAEALRALRDDEALREQGALILVGERAATAPGTLSAVCALADTTGARLAWIPRRAGERGAVEAGATPTLLPGGHPVAIADARSRVGARWKTDLPAAPGRDTDGILAAARSGAIGALLIAGVEPGDLPDPASAREAVRTAGFVVSLEVRRSEVTDLADVVFPVAPVAEKAGTFLDWEGRDRTFGTALTGTGALPDLRVLHALAAEMGEPIDLPDVAAARAELAVVGHWDGATTADPSTSPAEPRTPGPGQAILAGWRMLLDAGRMQDGEPHLAGTAHRPVARISAGTATEIGCPDGSHLVVSTDHGSVTLPVVVTDLPERVVWLPLNSPGSAVHRDLGVTVGALVRIRPARPGEGETS